jgi:hypothetical protein
MVLPLAYGHTAVIVGRGWDCGKGGQWRLRGVRGKAHTRSQAELFSAAQYECLPGEETNKARKGFRGREVREPIRRQVASRSV